ncbi:type II toxin-antitoxin system Phd/YefM family antitoxin [Sphingomonas sp. ac-8]|uniref:type II toxin-antitoxin system Phd/YefM family antitoxin n=1 Tax=Sphingomonas sp. ac-8 TaxID=3242977 RepID=UPI003A7F99E3
MAEADPHKIYNVHEAKTHFSRLIDRAHAGEEIVLAKAGVPYARLVPVAPATTEPRRPGRFAHLRAAVPSDVWFAPEYGDAELDRFEGKLADL